MYIPGLSTLYKPKIALTKSSDVSVEKPIPHTFDLGNLLCNDLNALSAHPSPEALSGAARDCAQALVNQILTTCQIRTTQESGTCAVLPDSTTPLPREKLLPKAKVETKWEQFARKKGIKPKSRSEGKARFDEDTGEWVPKRGYHGRKQEHDSNWVVEVDEKKEAGMNAGETIRGEERRGRKSQVRKNALRQKANTSRQRKGATRL